jgi:hypothetical protein
MSLDDFHDLVPEVNVWDQALPQAITTPDENPLMPGQILPPTTAQFTKDEFTRPITDWLPSKGHGGKTATSLTATHVREILTWLNAGYHRKQAVWVRRGPGSGEWTDTYQLGIIHKHVNASGSTEKATYHLMLRPKVYDDLAEVPFAGADWQG